MLGLPALVPVTTARDFHSSRQIIFSLELHGLSGGIIRSWTTCLAPTYRGMKIVALRPAIAIFYQSVLSFRKRPNVLCHKRLRIAEDRSASDIEYA